jgi:hypothetical protein
MVAPFMTKTCPNPLSCVLRRRFSPGVPAPAPISLISDQHPVDHMKHLPGGGDHRLLPPLTPLDSPIESGQVRVGAAPNVDMDRLGQDPPEVLGALLAHPTVPNGGGGLLHRGNQSGVGTQPLGPGESLPPDRSSQVSAGHRRTRCRDRRYQLGLMAAVELLQESRIDPIDLLQDTL